jgi:hypothetical protein
MGSKARTVCCRVRPARRACRANKRRLSVVAAAVVTLPAKLPRVPCSMGALVRDLLTALLPLHPHAPPLLLRPAHLIPAASSMRAVDVTKTLDVLSAPPRAPPRRGWEPVRASGSHTE